MPASQITIPPNVERCECPRCEGLIPTHFVFSRYDFDAAAPAARKLTIFCQHCDVFFEREFELRGGSWSSTGEPTPVSAAKRLSALQKSVRKIQNTQMALAS